MCYPVTSFSPSLWVQRAVNSVYETVKKIVLWILTKSFFGGYQEISFDNCQHVLKDRSFKKIEGTSLDAIEIFSSHPRRTGNLVVIADTTSYQDRIEKKFPRSYERFLDLGVDLVLWNPTQKEGKVYAKDLTALLQVLKEQHPDRKIVIKGHCAAVEPAIVAAAALKSPSISLILDRGYGDASLLARSFTLLSRLPIVGSLIDEHFACGGIARLKEIQGKIIFMAPQDPSADEVVYWKGRNFTYEMQALRQREGFTEDAFVFLKQQSNHWSSWNAEEFNQLAAELAKMEVSMKDPAPFTKEMCREHRPFSFWQRRCVPLLIKAWC